MADEGKWASDAESIKRVPPEKIVYEPDDQEGPDGGVPPNKYPSAERAGRSRPLKTLPPTRGSVQKQIFAEIAQEFKSLVWKMGPTPPKRPSSTG